MPQSLLASRDAWEDGMAALPHLNVQQHGLVVRIPEAIPQSCAAIGASP